MRNEEFFVQINKGSVDLEKFPASRVHQLAKKMESSKATARHIRQVAGSQFKREFDPKLAHKNIDIYPKVW